MLSNPRTLMRAMLIGAAILVMPIPSLARPVDLITVTNDNPGVTEGAGGQITVSITNNSNEDGIASVSDILLNPAGPPAPDATDVISNVTGGGPKFISSGGSDSIAISFTTTLPPGDNSDFGVNTVTFNVHWVGDTSGTIVGGTSKVTVTDPVPEPAATAAIGAIFLAACRRSRRR